MENKANMRQALLDTESTCEKVQPSRGSRGCSSNSPLYKRGPVNSKRNSSAIGLRPILPRTSVKKKEVQRLDETKINPYDSVYENLEIRSVDFGLGWNPVVHDDFASRETIGGRVPFRERNVEKTSTQLDGSGIMGYEKLNHSEAYTQLSDKDTSVGGKPNESFEIVDKLANAGELDISLEFVSENENANEEVLKLKQDTAEANGSQISATEASPPAYSTRSRRPQFLSPNTNNASEKESLPFACNLCSLRFKKKLFLNNHMERRHGIKFVFTEKGKKVKLIRMPEEHEEGEKLDPCVEALLQQNGQNASNILGVQTLDQRRIAEEFPTAHELDPADLLPGNTNRDFGAGILVNTIRTFAMKDALDLGHTPFVLYRPHLSKRLYLLSIWKISDDKQILIPTTEEEIRGIKEISAEECFSYKNLDLELQEPSTPTTTPSEFSSKACTRFTGICTVALAEQSMNENNRLSVRIYPPPAVYGQVSLMKFQHFAHTIIQCRPKRLRCLSIPPKPVARLTNEVNDFEVLPRMKRKYTKRGSYKKYHKGQPKKRGRKRLHPISSDEEVESEPEQMSCSDGDDEHIYNDSEDNDDRIENSPIRLPRRERKFTPRRLFVDDVAPPKRKYTRRGRPKKSTQLEVFPKHVREAEHGVKGERPEIDYVDGEDEDKEFVLKLALIQTPSPPRRRGRRHFPSQKSMELETLDLTSLERSTNSTPPSTVKLRSRSSNVSEDKNNESVAELDSEVGGTYQKMGDCDLPIKKRRRGRPRKVPTE